MFSEHIKMCLLNDLLEVESGEKFDFKEDPNVTIINLIGKIDLVLKQINKILRSSTQKIILIENGLDLYLNSENEIPFSVYSKMIPKNEICKILLDVENRILESKKNHVIFRTSEVYGISSPQCNIEKLLFAKNEIEFENSTHDFIYDGDVINAIEIALRKDVTGIFDIASGISIQMRQVAEIIKKIRNIEFDIKWKRKNLKIVFNCENFKYYKWEPLVNLETGLKTLLALRRRYGKLQST